MLKKLILSCIILFSMVIPVYATPTLNFGSATVSGATITIPIILTNTQDTFITGISTDISFSSDIFDLMPGSISSTVIAGTSALQAAKQVTPSNQGDGLLRIVIFGMSNTVISNGEVAKITLAIKSGGNVMNSIFTSLPTATNPQGDVFVPRSTFTVLQNTTAVNGVCKSSATNVLTILPTSTDLCLSGTTANITGNDPWNWDCTGINGGTTAKCSSKVLSGDCNSDGLVTIAEVQSAINMFLGLKTVETCVDNDKSGTVSIAEVQKTINSFLGL